MRKIAVPAGHIDVSGIESGTVTFGWFVLAMLNTDTRFNATGTGIRAAVRIERALTRGSEIFLEEADWTLLRDVVEAPNCLYPLNPARVLVPYVEAIAEAKPDTPTPNTAV